MSEIYTFNGKDITMNVFIQIRAVVDIIKEARKIDFIEALGQFYHSNTYKTLQNTVYCRLFLRKPLLKPLGKGLSGSHPLSGHLLLRK